MSTLKIITTRDGSHSLLHEQLNETYHSIHGAMQESVHVFIKHGLEVIIGNEIHILEVGFGTGLNALLTLRHSIQKKQTIYYTSLEAFPVEETTWSQLNYAETAEEKQWFEKLHRASWNEWTVFQPDFHLRKLHTTIQVSKLEKNHYDLIYFDAFAPGKQPEMWELPVLQKTTDALKAGGLFVTYCAKGQLKRDLKTLGLKVETLQGPPGKKEMVRAATCS